MYDSLVEQYKKAFGLESKQEVRTRRFCRIMRQYKTYTEIFGKRKAQKLVIKAISENKL